MPVTPRSDAKPPLGLRPESIADMEYCVRRGVEIVAAMQRYIKAEVPVPSAWTAEYKALHQRYAQYEAQGADPFY